MTKREYMEYHNACMEKMKAITKAKNADYTGTSDDPFANFTQTESVAGVSTEAGFLVRMGDKMARIKSFVQKGVLQVKDESVEDTLLDLANYCILMAGYINSQRPRSRQQPPAVPVQYTSHEGGILTVTSSPSRSN